MDSIVISKETVLGAMPLGQYVELNDIADLLGIVRDASQSREQFGQLFGVLEALVTDHAIHVSMATARYCRTDIEASAAAVATIIAPELATLAARRNREHDAEFFAQYN